jgi:hypothetical protein
VQATSLSVQLNGFPTLFQASTADYISPILPEQTWSMLAQQIPALALLPATSTTDYMKELQFVRMPTSSQELWKISPPAERDLLSVLNSDSGTPVDMTLHFTFRTQDGTLNEGSVARALSQVMMR